MEIKADLYNHPAYPASSIHQTLRKRGIVIETISTLRAQAHADIMTLPDLPRFVPHPARRPAPAYFALDRWHRRRLSVGLLSLCAGRGLAGLFHGYRPPGRRHLVQLVEDAEIHGPVSEPRTADHFVRL